MTSQADRNTNRQAIITALETRRDNLIALLEEADAGPESSVDGRTVKVQSPELLKRQLADVQWQIRHWKNGTPFRFYRESNG